MSWSPIQLKAIARHAAKHELVPQLSTYPTVYFKRKADAEQVTEQIEHLVDWYQGEVKRERRERAAELRQQTTAAKKLETVVKSRIRESAA